MATPERTLNATSAPPIYATPGVGSSLALTTLTNLALVVVSIPTSVFVARILGPAGRGELAAIQVWCLVFTMIGTAGLPEAVVYWGGRYASKAGTYAASALAIAFALMVPVAFAASAIFKFLFSNYSSGILDTAILYMMLMPVGCLGGLAVAALQARRDFLFWNVARLLPNLAWLFLLAALALVGSATSQTVATMHALLLVAYAIPVAIILRLRIPGPFELDYKKMGELLTFGVPSIAATLVQQLNGRIDQLAITAMFKPEDVGIYAVAVGWSMGFNPIFAGVGNVFLPHVASENVLANRYRVFSQIAKGSIVLTGGISVFGMVISAWVIPILFGDAYSGATSIAVLLIASAALTGFNGILESGLRGLGRPGVIIRAESVALIFEGILLYLVVPTYHLVGASICAAAGSFVVTLLLLYQIRQISGHKVTSFVFPNSTDFRLGRAWMENAAKGTKQWIFRGKRLA